MKTAKRWRRRRCRHCDREYEPDPRTAKRQRYCGRAECQKARRRRTAKREHQRCHPREREARAREQGGECLDGGKGNE